MFVRLFICFYSIFLFREKIFRYICINLKFCIMRNLILFVVVCFLLPVSAIIDRKLL